jgi:hypothetical protein
MPLPMTVLIVVLGVTVMVGIAAYLVDRSLR